MFICINVTILVITLEFQHANVFVTALDYGETRSVEGLKASKISITGLNNF